MLADVDVVDGSLVCYATGKRGVTLLTTTGGSSWTQQAGWWHDAAGQRHLLPERRHCYAVGDAGTLLKT